jgi:cyclophilin family peptidyl-prolyl cis-trans isomerase
MKFLTALMAMIAVATPALAKKKDPVPPTPVVTPDPVATPDNLWHLQLSTGGEVVVQLRPDKAPHHVERIKQLTRAGFYDGLLFHRVIDGFMAQTGDPQGTGQGGSSLPDLKSEFNDIPHLRGTASMARATDPNSANSQFFITLMPVFRLDNKYTGFGRVVSGMNYVDTIERGEPPANPAKIIKAYIEADGPNAQKVPLPAVVLPAAPPAPAAPPESVPAPAAPPKP